MEIVALIVCTSRVMKMKKYLSFCREFSILYIEDRVVFKPCCLTLKEKQLLKTQIFDG